MHDVAAIQALIEPLFPGLMGVRVTELAGDRVVAEMPVRADLCTAGGILHGGAYMAFADTLGAIGTIVNLGPASGRRPPTRARSSSPARASARP
jgi:acyl-coenzyme A thioesterase PaaI-like protein